MDYNLKEYIEDNYYRYYLDGRIYSKHKNDFLKLGKNQRGYFIFRDRNSGRKMKTVHRILYEKFYGEIPEGLQVDHINGIRDDNRLVNLQLLSQQHNCQKQGINSKNTSGYKGVHFHKNHKKWVAHIKLNGKKIHLGLFKNIDEAIEARKQKVDELNALGNHYT